VTHRIALVGAGRIGRIHAANIAAAPGLELRYIVDPLRASAEEVAVQTGADVAEFAEALADPRIAGVVIASSTDTHLNYSVRAIEAGKAVLCEKPLDLDVDKARAAGPVLGKPGERFIIGFNRRFDPHFLHLHELIQSGVMGKLETLHIISHDPAPPPADYVKVSGGMFKDMSIHDFDMARWLLGEEPVEIFAAGGCLVDPAIGEAGDIDTAKILLRTASGTICLISNSRRSGYGYDQRIEAFCSKGRMGAGNVVSTTVERSDESGSMSGPLQNFFLDRYAQAYRAEVAHFAAVLDGREAPMVSYADGLAALNLAEAAAASLHSKQRVRVSPVE